MTTTSTERAGSDHDAPDRPRPRVVVVGSGFGGYFAARTAQRKLGGAAEVVLVSDTDAMLYQPMLPDVAVGALDPRTVAVPLLTSLPKVTHVRGRVTSVDLDARSLRVEEPGGDDVDPDGRDLGYDHLVLAVGGVTRLLDIPGLAEHAVGFKTVAEAMYLRELVLGRLEAADQATDETQRRAALTFVVVGAGYAGTELTAQMARMTQNLLPSFPGLRGEDVHWLLLDVAKAVMPELGGELGDAALRLLRERGVDVRLGTSIDSMTDSEVHLTDGTRLDCRTVVWCAGVAANPLVGSLGLPTTKGRLVVDENLAVPGHPEVHALGDCAAVPDLTKDLDDDGNRPLCPPTAQHAMRQGPAAARNVVAAIEHRGPTPYRHHDLGLVVDLGGRGAAASPLGVHLKGVPAKVVTRGYHLFALPTVRRRARVVADWALTGKRPDDVSFGLLELGDALASRAEHDG